MTQYRLSIRCGMCQKETLAQFACVKCGMTLCREHMVRDEASVPLCPFCAAGRSPELARLLKALAILGVIALAILEVASPQLIRAMKRLVEALKRRD